jgi:predicted amidophosphoribosyltransferase
MEPQKKPDVKPIQKEEVHFCSQCGANFTERPNVKYCAICGNELDQ